MANQTVVGSQGWYVCERLWAVEHTLRWSLRDSAVLIRLEQSGGSHFLAVDTGIP